MIVGSAGDTGRNSRVDLYVGFIKDLARKHGLATFRIGFFYFEVGTAYLRRKIETGDTIHGLDACTPLDLATRRPATVWSMAGVHPYIELRVTALLPAQRCTVASAAGHAMYERPNPYYAGRVKAAAALGTRGAPALTRSERWAPRCRPPGLIWSTVDGRDKLGHGIWIVIGVASARQLS